MLNRFSYLMKVLYMIFKYLVVLVVLTQLYLVLENNTQISREDSLIIIGLGIGTLVALSIGEWVVLAKLIWNFSKKKVEL